MHGCTPAPALASAGGGVPGMGTLTARAMRWSARAGNEGEGEGGEGVASTAAEARAAGQCSSAATARSYASPTCAPEQAAHAVGAEQEVQDRERRSGGALRRVCRDGR